MTIKITIILSVFLLLLSCSKKITNLEEPKHIKGEQYIKHFAYSLQYNEKNEQANWVAYNLLSTELVKNYKRTNKFIVDKAVKTETANNNDYSHSGYDRGHLAPAADMTWNKQAMQESFYFSNMSPQVPAFNRGIWKKLEAQTRNWAKKYKSIYIATGPICDGYTKTIGKNKVVVPTYYYKAILLYNDSNKQAIGFILPNKKCKPQLP